MKKISSAIMLLFLLIMSGNSSAAGCIWLNWECFASFLLPNNQTNTTDVHEWTAYEGHVYGFDNIIEFRLRFNAVSLQTLNATSFGQPFALEVDISEANNGNLLDFDRVESNFPADAKAIQDVSAFNDVNANKNADGLLIRDARAIQSEKDYIVRFYLKNPLPADGVAVVPYLQISYNTHYFQIAPLVGNMMLSPAIPTAAYPFDSPWNFFPLESDGYVGPRENVFWKLYQDGREGIVWNNKGSSRKGNAFTVVSGKVMDSVQMDRLKRLDYLDKVCRQVNPNPLVEQFRNLMTGNITIYRTPNDALGQRYANANCDVGAFVLPSHPDGDGSGSGSTSGMQQSSKPNLTAIDTFVTYGESASTTKVMSSDRVFLGTPLWCQMRMQNTGSADATSAFDSACYVSVGKKFDGWNDATSLGFARTQSLAKGATKTEHKGIDILVYPNWYNVVSKIDANGNITETIETDNFYNKDDPFAFQVWGRPNVVAAVSADKASYALNETVSATASFSNTGANPYGKTGYVDWYVDGAILSEQDRVLRENLHPGVSGKVETISFPVPQSYGTHEIKTCFRYAVDDLVEEVQPADNCAANTFSVPDPAPPVVVVAPVASPPVSSPPPDTTGSEGPSSYVPSVTVLPPLTDAEEEDEMNAVYILLNGI